VRLAPPVDCRSFVCMPFSCPFPLLACHAWPWVLCVLCSADADLTLLSKRQPPLSAWRGKVVWIVGASQVGRRFWRQPLSLPGGWHASWVAGWLVRTSAATGVVCCREVQLWKGPQPLPDSRDGVQQRAQVPNLCWPLLNLTVGCPARGLQACTHMLLSPDTAGHGGGAGAALGGCRGKAHPVVSLPGKTAGRQTGGAVSCNVALLTARISCHQS
jgi:hypothetical protein